MLELNELFLRYLAMGFEPDDAMLWAKNEFEDKNEDCLEAEALQKDTWAITDDNLNLDEL
jgi:hypothetical protein